jgi:beta-lactamase superfamily II metal-dependent hydrolase
MASAWETSGRGAVDCHCRTAPGSTNVRAGAAIELSHTGSVAFGNDYFFNNAGGRRGMFAPAIRRAQADDMELVGVLAAAGIVIATYPFSPRIAAGKLELTVLDVGQGDSLFVVSPMGETLLIDGGGAFGGFPGHEETRGSDPGEEAVSPYLWSRGFKKIDAVALTHAHQDHLGGLNAILENFRIGRLWLGREVNNPALARLEALARERNISLEYETRGKQFSLDEVQGNFCGRQFRRPMPQQQRRTTIRWCCV